MGISVKNKNVLVVGASSGIGRATAMLFAKAGAHVVAAARREERLRHLQEELERSGAAIDIEVADASQSSEMDRLISETESRIGNIAILIYATGTNTPDRSMAKLNPEIWNMMLDVNLNGAYYVTRAVLPSMRNAGGGLLIYISSISGLMADASGASYQAAKRGILGLAHAVRYEEKENGIRTCVVCPGLVETELLEKRPVKPSAETLQAALQPQDVAEMILAIATLPARAVVPEIQILPAYL